MPVDTGKQNKHMYISIEDGEQAIEWFKQKRASLFLNGVLVRGRCYSHLLNTGGNFSVWETINSGDSFTGGYLGDKCKTVDGKLYYYLNKELNYIPIFVLNNPDVRYDTKTRNITYGHTNKVYND